MFEHDLFDIPVYRISEEEYEKEFENSKIYRALQEHKDLYDKNRELMSPIIATAISRQAFGGPWLYNEIIGFIRLYFSGSQLLGKYYENDARVHRKTRKKIFVYKTHKLFDEIEVPTDSNNQDIFELVMEYLEQCKKTLNKRTKATRYVDSSILIKNGPFIDWKKIFEMRFSSET